MKVLLISTNQLRPSGGSPWMPVEPLGMAYIAASLRNAGHEVEALDLCFEKRPAAAVAGALARFRPRAIGISFRNLEVMAYFQNISFIESLRSVVDICRSHSEAWIVLGGSGFSVMPEQILKYTGVGLGIVGEGEWSFPGLLSRLELGGDCSDIPGVVRLEDGGTRVTRPVHDRDFMKNLLIPARDLIDHRPYIEANGTANLQTKRGCPFSCIYCTYPLIEGTDVRCRSPVDVANEFRLLNHEFGIHNVFVVDNQFNYPPRHAKSICEELVSIRDEVKVRWSCMLNPGYITEELVLLLRLARCATVELGLESASDRMLGNLGKNFTRRDVRDAINILNEYKLRFNAWILLGGPGETGETVKETLEFLAEVDIPNVLFSIGVRVCPGTRIERMMRDGGELEPDADLLDPVFYLSMDAAEMVDIVRPYCAGREGWHIAALEHPDFSRSG